MIRRLVLNWCDAHRGLKKALGDGVEDPLLLPATGEGWTFATFCPLGTRPTGFLFDVERIRVLAAEHHFSLPHEIVAQHNKVVVTATSADGRHSTQLHGLFRLLDTFCKRYRDAKSNPRHEFYGKLGGVWKRPEKGRVWAIYSRGDEALLEICASIEGLVAERPPTGCSFEVSLANGLSALPRVLEGLDDPDYLRSGADHFRINDLPRFHSLLDQALADHSRYLFE